MQPPSVALRVVLLGAVAVALIGIILFRLWFLQILSAQQYVAQANDNRLRTWRCWRRAAPCSTATGTVIVNNRPGLAVGIRLMDVPAEQLDDWSRAWRSVLRHEAGRRSGARSCARWACPGPGQARPRPGSTTSCTSSRTPAAASSRTCSSTPPASRASRCSRTTCAPTRWATWRRHFLGQLGEIDPQRAQADAVPAATWPATRSASRASSTPTTVAARHRRLGARRGRRQRAGPSRCVPGGTPAAARRQPHAHDRRRACRGPPRTPCEYGIDLAHDNGELRANGGAAVVLDAHTGEVIAMAS